jgi:hypothetical protein
MRITRHFVFALMFGVLMASTAVAEAQPLGTLRWNFAPYCNVVTALVEQKGAVFELTGTDDGCTGVGAAATVNGSAHFNPGGALGMSLAIVRPDGFVINAAINLDVATLSGTWRDDWANSGTFTFNPTLPVAAPPRRLTMRGNWAVESSGPGFGAFSFPHPLPSAPGAGTANVIPFGGVSTANCPGTVSDPQAAPGQLCLYERYRQGASAANIFSTGTGDLARADSTGFGVYVLPSDFAGTVTLYGRWAVTVP